MGKPEIQDTYSTFFPFSRLPPELRNMTWREALDREVGLTLYPYNRGCWHQRWVSAPDIGLDDLILEFRDGLLNRAQMEVPVAFVNTEARRNAIAWALKQGSRILTCFDGNVPVFLRALNPDRDALYVASDQWDDFTLEPLERAFEPDMLRKRHILEPCLVRIALPKSLVQNPIFRLQEMFDQYYDARMLCIVNDTPSNLWPHGTHNTVAKQCFYEREASQRVAAWDGSRWEFDFTSEKHSSSQSRSLVQKASGELREGLVEMRIQYFEIHFIS
ncbi:hypothetical protein GGR53DRAFT_153461 [Hypoxylon sp. FL1150]|nr:hypothetical protein GGR53DRAFT_153461 [Hypoxylon sp. FL1150]